MPPVVSTCKKSPRVPFYNRYPGIYGGKKCLVVVSPETY
jgi:hypothetical protein